MPDARRYHALDSWRGVCAILVVVHHLVLYSVNDYDGRMVSSLFLAVDFFFVLSGFVIMSAYGHRLTRWTDFVVFILKRIARVWPLHLAVMLGFLVLIGVLVLVGVESPYTIGATETRYAIVKFPLVLLLTNSLGLYSGGWNLPSWSISAEMMAYVCFGVLLLARSRLVGVLVVTLASAAVLVAYNGLYLSPTSNFGFVRCFFGFGVGVLTYALVEASRARQPHRSPRSVAFATVLEAAVLALVVVAMYHSVGAEHEALALSMVMPLLFAALVVVYASEAGLISRLLLMRLPRKLGEVSYSIYMVHWLLLLAVAAGWRLLDPSTTTSRDMWGGTYLVLDLGTDARFWIFSIAYVLGTVLISLATFRWIEDPWRRRGSAGANRVGAQLRGGGRRQARKR